MGPPNGHVESKGDRKKFVIFDQYLDLFSEMIENSAIVTMKCEYETVPKLSNGAISNDLE